MKRGLFFTLLSYLIWGLFPLFWKNLSHIPAFESLAHRIFWAFFFVAGIITLSGRWKEVRAVVRDRKSRWVLLMSVAFMAVNWFVFIWSVNHNSVVTASLGYYLNPLVSVVLGMVFLKERLDFWQAVAVSLAFIGVFYLVASHGRLPLNSLILAICFSVYGLLRKIVTAEALVGLFVELVYIVPIAFLFIVLGNVQGKAGFLTSGASTTWLLMLAGPVTALPLFFFSYGARRLPLSTVGILQYLPPTMQFLCGVFVFREPFPMAQKVCFAFIWTALLVFSVAKTNVMQKLTPARFAKAVCGD